MARGIAAARPPGADRDEDALIRPIDFGTSDDGPRFSELFAILELPLELLAAWSDTASAEDEEDDDDEDDDEVPGGRAGAPPVVGSAKVPSGLNATSRRS